jgi:hypothetical protein
VDELLWDLNKAGHYTIRFADYIAIVIRGKFPTTVSEVLQFALETGKLG